MAKVRSIINLSGTVSGVTFVDSAVYGAHARAKRGTYTPVTLAEGMKASALAQKQANVMAKVVFDALNDFVPGFKNGKLWSRLLSAFRQLQKMDEGRNYNGFNLKEMRLDYPSTKHGSFTLTNGLTAGLLLKYHLFKEVPYRLRLMRIATDETMMQFYANEVLFVDVKAVDQEGELPFNFSALPANAATLYVLHCEQLVDHQPASLLKSKAVIFLKVE